MVLYQGLVNYAPRTISNKTLIKEIVFELATMVYLNSDCILQGFFFRLVSGNLNQLLG